MYFSLEGAAWAQWEPSREYSVTLDASRGRVRVWVEGTLFQWHDPSFSTVFEPVFLQVGVAGMAARLQVDETQRPRPRYANGNNIWCVLPKSCKCKPGYDGDFCTSLCPSGSFGEDCAHQCGFCLGAGDGSGTCDPITGTCPIGCKQGFLPPLCTEELVRLEAPPVVRAINATALEVVVDVRRRVGRGTPHTAVVQFRSADGLQGLRRDAWESLPALQLPALEEGGEEAEVRAEVGGLRPGSAYRVRVLLLTEDGIWSPRAPVALNATSCAVPDSFDYKVYAYIDPHRPKTIVRWLATGAGAQRCGVRAWRLLLRAPSVAWQMEQERKEPLRGAQMDAPPAPAELTVEALTASGALPPSRPVPVLATLPELGPVQDLAVAQHDSRMATITWRPPTCCSDVPLAYTITLKCERLVHCVEPCLERERRAHVAAGAAQQHTFSGLRPDARYHVEATAQLEGGTHSGQVARLVFDTMSAAPSVKPDLALFDVKIVSSQGFELAWRLPSNCSSLNGFGEGVHYALRAVGNAAGSTDVDTGAEDEEKKKYVGLATGQGQRFKDLRPATTYVVTLHLVTRPGHWNPALGADVTVTTLPEGAETVRVHEAARDRVALRWMPREGSTDEEVTVTRLAEGGSNQTARESTTPCPIWRAMRCLTLSGLLSDTRYDLWIHIPLNNSQEQEEIVHLVTRTVEGSPSAPRELRAEGASATGLRLRWRAPAQRGGVLRNFVIIVYHVRSYAAGACCEPNRIDVVEIDPSIEASDEHDSFEHEVTGLPPASTFTVSVSAVTASTGPVAYATAHTAPLLPPSSAAPLKLLPAPGACLRARLPASAVTAATAPAASAPDRRLFTFLTSPENERAARVASTGTAAETGVATSVGDSTLPDALLQVLPSGYTALQEVFEVENGTVCVGGARGAGQRAGLALLLQYGEAAAAAAWRSDPFDLLDCFRAPAHSTAYTCL